jgi:hypothetical protein
MSPPSLSDLPTELICQIFQSAVDFSAVAALAKTARIFYSVWREHAFSIYGAVAPYAISALVDAERLVDMQEFVEAGKAAEAAEAVGQSLDSRHKSIVRIKRILSNMRCASAVTDEWVDFCKIQDWREDKIPMTPAEITRFQHAFYCSWIIGVIASDNRVADGGWASTEESDPREVYRFHEFTIWARCHSKNEFGSLDIDFHDPLWTDSGSLLSGIRRIHYLDGRRINCCRYLIPVTPEDFIAFFDHTHHWLEKLIE